jgi:nucleoside-diphosphate-sugar epimerase
MENILVTGAGGFIGYHLGNYLSDRGHRVTGVDLHYPDNIMKSSGPRFRTVSGDFRDKSLMNELLSGTDIIFHLASAHLQIRLSESEYWDINVHSLRSFLDMARNCGVHRFIHVSSVGAYGNLNVLPANEETECNPQSVYGETKIAGEAEVRKFSDETGFPVVIIRPAWVYGPGCPRTEKLYRTLCKGGFIMIGDGDNMRHPVYIADILDAFGLAMENKSAVGEMFVIGGERAITTNELIDTFCKVFEMKKPKIRIPYTVGAVLATIIESFFSFIKKEPPISRRTLEFFDTNNAFDISKARKMLGFNPRFNFEDGLRQSRGWLEGSSRDVFPV